MVTYNIQKSDPYNQDDDPYNNLMYDKHIASQQEGKVTVIFYGR